MLMKFASVLVIFCIYLLAAKTMSAMVQKIGDRRAVAQLRILYIKKVLTLSLTLIFGMLMFLSLGIEYAQVSLFLSSIFAVIGVALFAQWSILSNITASLVIFFAFPYRVGDEIKVVDQDDDISGVIEEIGLFHVLIRRGEELITYPNSQILQKAVIKKPCADYPQKPENSQDTKKSS